MKLINTEGMAFIGPGSEWFWTAVSGLVLAVTFLAIYRQLRLQASANAFEQGNKMANEWGSERNTRYRLDVLVALRDGTDPAHVPFGAAASLADYWDTVGALVRAGRVDRKLVYENLAVDVQSWWATLAPFLRRYRIESGDAKGDEHFEWLADVMARMARKAGVAISFDEESVASSVDRRIQRGLDEIRLAEELRAVIVRPMSPVAFPAPRPARRRGPVAR